MSDKNLSCKYDNRMAILLAGMCYQTYPYFLTDTLILPKEFTLKDTIYAQAGTSVKVTENFGFIAESDDAIIIALRGTDSLADSESIFDLFQVEYVYAPYYCKIHRGGFCIYQSMRESLFSMLKTLSPSKKLYITGHSLGGSLSQIISVDIASHTAFNPTVYSYAAGRPGAPDFAQDYGSYVPNSFRIYNVHDWVPTYPSVAYPPPFTKEGLYYEHVGIPFTIDFQLNAFWPNHGISCYIKVLSQSDPSYANYLRSTTPGFLPDEADCYYHSGKCQ